MGKIIQYQDPFRKLGNTRKCSTSIHMPRCPRALHSKWWRQDADAERLSGEKFEKFQKSIEIEIYKTIFGFKTDSLDSLVMFEFIDLPWWSLVFFEPGLFGTWTHPATNRVRLGWICATDFFKPQQLKPKRSLGKAVQDAAKRKGLKYDSTKPEGKLEKRKLYSREWARCSQGNWRTWQNEEAKPKEKH